jgi:hypothetical protein
MEEYEAAKASLFQPDRSRRAVVCTDDAAGPRIAAGPGCRCDVRHARAGRRLARRRRRAHADRAAPSGCSGRRGPARVGAGCPVPSTCPTRSPPSPRSRRRRAGRGRRARGGRPARGCPGGWSGWTPASRSGRRRLRPHPGRVERLLAAVRAVTPGKA